MDQEIKDPAAMLATIIQQEEALSCDSFTFEDAWKLGLMIRERVLRHGGNGTVDVTIGGVQLFRCGIGEPTPNNTRWIRRKMNTVLETWKSSLRVSLEMSLSGRTLDEFGLIPADYVLSGGSFPIRVHEQGVIGTATVSGFPQTHDHQLVVDTLSDFLSVSVPSILE